MGAAKRASQSRRRTVRAAVGVVIFLVAVVGIVILAVSGILDSTLTQLDLNIAPLTPFEFGQLLPVLWIACGLLTLVAVIALPAWIAHRMRQAQAERREQWEAAHECRRHDEALRQRQIAEECQREEIAEESRQRMIAERMPLAHRLGLPSALDLGQVTLQHFLDLDPTSFELAIGEVLTLLGYMDVVHTGRSGDGGIDLKCRDLRGRPVDVQCKRQKHPVDFPTVKEWFFDRSIAMFPGYPERQGLFVTTARYTSPARGFAADNRGRLRLVDGTLLVKIVRKLVMPEPDAPSTPPGEPLRPAA